MKLATIGMHVGGGPYDEATKEPLRRSVEPRFPDLAACWRHVPPGTGPLEVGVDLVVEADGGTARVTNPRSRVKGEAFIRCVTDFYASVAFQRPLHGRTVVSYSVRFTP